MPGQTVHIRVESVHQGDALVQQVEGEMYRKGDAVYYRYAEPDDETMGQTSTTVKLKPDEIRIIRHGDVRAEQTFSPNAQYNGYYQTSQIRLQLVTETTDWQWNMEESGCGQAAWSYVLWIGDERAGEFQLRLSIREEQE